MGTWTWRQVAPNLLTADRHFNDAALRVSCSRASRGNGFPGDSSLLLGRSIDLRGPLCHAGEFVLCARRPQDMRAPDIDLPELQSCRLSRGRLNGMRRCKCTSYTTPAPPAVACVMYVCMGRERLCTALYKCIFVAREECGEASGRRARCSWDG